MMGTINMTKLKFFCILLILLSLISCDDKAAKATTAAQNFPQFDSFQAPSEVDQLKARLVDNPRDFETLSALGDKYFESNRYLEAIQTYDKALVINPKCADCLNDRGLAMFYMGNAKSALESFDKAIAIEPGYAHVWLSKGFVLVSESRYQEAIPVLHKVNEVDATGNLVAEADRFIAMAV